MSWSPESVRERLPQGIDCLLDTLCLCGDVEAVYYRKDGEDWELRFEFCGELFQCSLCDDGEGYGPAEADGVYVFADDPNAVMRWIAYELAARLQKIKGGAQ